MLGRIGLAGVRGPNLEEWVKDWKRHSNNDVIRHKKYDVRSSKLVRKSQDIFYICSGHLDRSLTNDPVKPECEIVRYDAAHVGSQ